MICHLMLLINTKNQPWVIPPPSFFAYLSYLLIQWNNNKLFPD